MNSIAKRRAGTAVAAWLGDQPDAPPGLMPAVVWISLIKQSSGRDLLLRIASMLTRQALRDETTRQKCRGLTGGQETQRGQPQSA